MEKKPSKMISPKKWGKKHGEKYPTVVEWCRKGLIPGVIKTELPSGGHHYSIPEDAPKPITKRGPKPKTKPLDDHTKVQVLETLRQFGGHRLTDKEKEAIAANHAKHFLELAKTASQKLFGGEQNAWMARLEHEHENLRVALDYYGSNQSTTVEELEMTVSLGRFWDIGGHYSEGRQRLQHSIGRQSSDTSLKARALAWLGHLAFAQDSRNAAKEALTTSLAISQRIGDKESLAFALFSRGSVAESEGDYEQAKALLTESITLSRQIGVLWLTGWAVRWLGVVYEAEGDYEGARDCYSQYLSISEQMEHAGGIAGALDHLGTVARLEGDFEQARQHHQKALALRVGGGNKWGTGGCFFNLGLLEESANQPLVASVYFQRALDVWRQINNHRGMARAMEGIARAMAALGKDQEAARAFGAADTLRSSITAPLSPAEQKQYGEIIASAKKRFRSDWNSGARLPIDEAITHALSFNQADEGRKSEA